MTTNPNDFTLEAKNKEHKSLRLAYHSTVQVLECHGGISVSQSFEMEKWVCGLSFLVVEQSGLLPGSYRKPGNNYFLRAVGEQRNYARGELSLPTSGGMKG